MVGDGAQDLGVVRRRGLADVVEVVARLVADVEMQFALLEVRDDLADGGDGLVDLGRVLLHQRHADDGLEVRFVDAAQPPEGLDAAIPGAGQSAHLLVQFLRPVDADRHHQPADAALEVAIDERDRLVAEPAGRRKIEEEQRLAAV